ncbi:aldo/keto reductase [Candidatus Pelagibacter sp. HIMB1506]|uniref:aldo/keto reductase n=1 Tax=Candidatus Pelagibacter sp. HIMB1506 TaxID=3413337 RepID=UPI003F8572A5
MNIILGTAQLMDGYGLAKKKLYKKDLTEILNLAKKKKCNFLDTAIAYKDVDKTLSKLNLKKFNILTKVKKLDYINTVKEVKKSKKLIGISKFHTIFLHDEKELLSKKKNKNYKILKKLKLLNLTKFIGLSAYSKKNTIEIIKNFKIDALQLPLNLFDRRFIDKEFLEMVKVKKIKLYFRSIFLQGALIDKKLYKREEKLNRNKYFKNYFKWLKENKKNPIEITMNFLNQVGIKKVIVGVSSKSEYKEIIKNINFLNNKMIPNFDVNQNDNNYIYRTDYWNIK